MKYFSQSNSEAGQESFVLNMLDEKKNGYYVEIGAFESRKTSNTYLLEGAYDWKGVALEIVLEHAREYNSNRNNPCLCADATDFDYLGYFVEHNFPKQIDYLQVDIEPASQTLKALKQVPLEHYRFSVITFEHDLYYGPENIAVKQEQKELLTSLGYELAVENVMVDAPGWPLREFEDWWIDPKVVSKEKYQDLKLRYM